VSNRRKIRPPRGVRTARSLEEWASAIQRAPGVSPQAKAVARAVSKHAKPGPDGDFRFTETPEFMADAAAELRGLPEEDTHE
jgi:hypothetical protein